MEEKLTWFWDFDYIMSRFTRSKNKVKTLAYLYYNLECVNDNDDKKELLETCKLLALMLRA